MNDDDSMATFDASVVERPRGRPDFEFVAPGAGSRSVWIAVEPKAGSIWSGTFLAPDPGVRALSVLLRTPTPTGLCVVERGTAFLGDVLDPPSFKVLPTKGPVVDAQSLLRYELLLLLTPWAITAIDRGGVRWTTNRIAIDGLRIDSTEDGWAGGVADPEDEDPREFRVNLSTGQVVGGAGIA
ncbi:MAG: hypothetical protein U0667_16480 [Chloroflexota bacterium]